MVSTATSYDVMETVQFSVVFRDATTLATVDPATVIFRIKPSAGALRVFVYGVDAALVRDAVGQYRISISLNEPDNWDWRWEGFDPAGGIGGASEGQILVKHSVFY